MKKLIIILFLIPLFSGELKAQSLTMLQADSTYRDFYPPVKANYGSMAVITQTDSTHADSTVSYNGGNVTLEKDLLIIDSAAYLITEHEDIKCDANNQYWQILDLSDGITCTLRWKSNFELMAIDLQPGDGVLTRYYIK